MALRMRWDFIVSERMTRRTTSSKLPRSGQGCARRAADRGATRARLVDPLAREGHSGLPLPTTTLDHTSSETFVFVILILFNSFAPGHHESVHIVLRHASSFC